MNRLERAAVLLTLVEKLREKGSWCGETHVQKATFFLQNLLGATLEYQFILYKHGPYSFDLSDDITAMRADHLIDLEAQRPPYGPSLVPGRGRDLIRRLYPRASSEYQNEINLVAETLGMKSAPELERIATAHFVTVETEHSGDAEERARRINELKPHVSIEQARHAVSFADEFRKKAQALRQE